MTDHESDDRPATDAPAPEATAEGAATRVGGDRWRLVTVTFAVGAVVMTAVAVYLWTAGPDGSDAERTEAPHDVTGVLTMIDQGYGGVPGPGCKAEVGEGEVAGTAAYLVDGQGNQLATSTLGEGAKNAMFECRFTVVFPDVPPVDALRFVVEGVGSSDVVARSQLASTGWVVPMTSGTLGT